MFKLVCTTEHFHDPVLGRRILKGETLTNQDHVERFMEEREREFVKVTMSPAEEAAEKARQKSASPPAPPAKA
jgi:hypothetical protein